MFWGTKNCQFSVYFKWIIRVHTALPVTIHKSRSKAVKTPLVLLDVSAGSVCGAFASVCVEWFLHSAKLGRADESSHHASRA